MCVNLYLDSKATLRVDQARTKAMRHCSRDAVLQRHTRCARSRSRAATENVFRDLVDEMDYDVGLRGDSVLC